MDDGKCLLDVISDPQALKEFFRSPSQIGFVDSEVGKEGNIIGSKQDLRSAVSNKTSNYVVTNNTQSNISLSNNPQQASSHPTSLTHYSYANTPSTGRSSHQTHYTSSSTSSLKNGHNSNIVNQGASSYNNTHESTSSLLNRNIPLTKHGGANKEQSFINTPLSFAFGDQNKARTLLSSSAHSTEKLQQQIVQNVQLKQSSPQLLSNVVQTNSPTRNSNAKGSPLAPLRPKKIIPRPTSQQHGNTVNQNDQPMFSGQGIGTVIATGNKPQSLVAIQPKLILTSQANQNPSNVITQAVINKSHNNLPLGSVQNQGMNTLLLQQGKPTTIKQVGNQSKVTGLVQLQPKQIAPKPGQPVSFQTNTGQKISQEQLQQQLVQNILVKTQQKQPSQQQFVVGNTTSGTKEDQQTIDAQNQLKELLQRNQLLQQVIQNQRLVQQQQQQPGTATVNNVVQGALKAEQNQASPLQSLMNSTVQQKALLTPTNTVTAAAAGTSNALNPNQLQQFLEKNPLVAQQLKQMNTKQIGNTRVVPTTTNITTIQNTKGTVSIQRVPQFQQTTQKKIVVASTQPQSTTIVNQTLTPEQKVPGAQKVLLVQQSPSGTNQTVGQPRILLQTKDGKPILLTQDQFKQIQQQLASKNLAIQAKLVTTTTTPQVVKQSDHSVQKTVHKVPTTATITKQDVNKGIKRPMKVVETPESKLMKKMKLGLQKDQSDVCSIDLQKPFSSIQDAVKKLVPFHVFSEPDPNEQMRRKANFLLDKLALQLTNKGDRMINKYRQLLFGDMQRDVSSAEVVMVNRIFLADEKLALMNKKKQLLEEVKNASNIPTDSHLLSTSIKQDVSATTDDSFMNKDDSAIDFLLSSTSLLDENKQSPLGSESQPIDIMDDSPSPMASANTFLMHVDKTSHSTDYTPPEPS